MAKVKVSATIDREIVQWVDGQIKTRRLRDRSHAIEWALAKVAEKKTTK